MKLNLVPARNGVQWVKLGAKTFAQQPLAMAGLFFMFMAAITVVTIVPLIGSALALALLPAATLGLMAATQEAAKGNFPMPSILVSAFRAGRQRAKAMLVLGAIYAIGFLLVMGFSTLFDGGTFAKLYLFGGPITPELVANADFQTAFIAAMALYLPLSLLFWHAPALVHWHGVSPVKALFFSFVACMKNWRAFLVYGLVWAAVFSIGGTLVMMIFGGLGGQAMASAALVPTILLMGAMLFTSIYFTFKDCFEAEPDTP
jgi:hypothetical protein